ncbi:MAG: 3'-5' exonuclease [Roseburia sp.]|nr:3'-5' exonuclease [Roseburia sp.]
MNDVRENYVVFDIETTGLSPKYEKIIEIGAARIADGEVADTFSTFVNPGKSLPPRIVELTGITDIDVINAPYIEEIFDAFVSFAGDDVLLGHNLLFDYSFVKKAAVNQKKTFERKGIDTLRIARRFLTDLDSRRLSDLCGYYGIYLEAHRALNDAIATHMLYRRLVADFYEKEPETFLPRELVYSAKKESPVTQKQYEHVIRLARRFGQRVTEENGGCYLEPVAGVTTERTDIGRLSRNEASRLIDGLLANFGR